MKIFYLTKDTSASRWYRCQTPGVALSELLSHGVAMGSIISSEIVSYFDVIVIHREHQSSTLKFIREAQDLKKLIVYDLDDNLWHLDPKNPSSLFWKRPEVSQGVIDCIKASDIVTVSTNYLGKVISHLNKNINLLPNMLPSKFWQVEREKHPGKVIVGWAGGAQHFSDLEILRGVIEQILDDYPQVEINLAGMPSYPFKSQSRIRMLKVSTVENYPKETLSRFDIGLAPLIDNQFNRCKSDLKFIEYGILGIPMIGSPVQPYLESVEHGKTGFLAKNPKDWLKYLKRLIEDEDLRKEIGENARKVAEKRTIEKNVHLWEEVYWENLQRVRGKAQRVGSR